MAKREEKTLTSRHTLSFIFQFSAIIFSGFLIFGLLTIALLNRNLGATYSEEISTLNRLHLYLPLIIITTVFIQALTLSAAAMLAALIWSHSISGPLLRFRKHLREIAQGKILQEPVTFREGDQLYGIAQAFSEMIIAHKGNSAKALFLLVQAQETLDECKFLEKNEKINTPEFNLKLKKLKTIYMEIKNIYTPA